MVFELVHKDYEKVVIKVNAKDPLTVAMNPFVSAEMEYITVTRGKNQNLTVVKTDGKTFSFFWGESGHTLISESLGELKREVVRFIEQECHIPLQLTSDVTSAKIFYNHNFGKWQLTLNENACIWSNTANSFESMREFANNFVSAKNWTQDVAITGIDIWNAIL